MCYKLFYMLLGCTPAGRHTEQHDVFFCIAKNLKETIPHIQQFWPDAGKIHIDSWREVNTVDQFEITIIEKEPSLNKLQHLFFINLGGYLPGSFEEHHYKHLTIAPNIGSAISNAKKTKFYTDYSTDDKHAVSHIDNKYGVDVDEILNVEDILPEAQRKKFSLRINPKKNAIEDPIHIGYLTLHKIT